MKTKSNAFTINRLHNSPFPFGSNLIQSNGIFCLTIFPVAISDILDTFLPMILENIIVYDVDTNNYKELPDGNLGNISLSELAKEHSIPFKEIDKEIGCFDKSGFKKLIESINHYNFNFYDSILFPSPDEITDSYLNLSEHHPDNFQYLSVLPSSSNYLNSHDDCYLYWESRSSELIFKLVTTTIKTFAETILSTAINNSVVDVPINICHSLYSKNGMFTIFPGLTKLSDFNLTIPVSFNKYEFIKEKDYPVDIVITYNLKENVWDIS